MKKTIALCIPSLTIAGAERFVTELACALDKGKFNPFVLVTKKYDTNAAFYKLLKNEGIEIIDGTAKSYLKQIFKLHKILRIYKPSIVHSNVSSVLYMVLPLALSGIKTKHIFTVHSMGQRIFSGIKQIIVRWCFRHTIIVPVAICDVVKKSIVDTYEISESDVECVFNGVDTKAFKKNENIFSGIFTFIIVGTLYHIKNHDLLLRSFKLVNDLYPNTKLVVVGDGELKNELILTTKSLGIERSVDFVGNQVDVKEFLNRADVYCCASKVEGLPLAVLEAMSMGLPVISTAAGGVTDIVKDDVNGFIVEDNEFSYSEKMIYLYENEKTRKKCANESRLIAESCDIQIEAREYEKLYDIYSRSSNENERCKDAK